VVKVDRRIRWHYTTTILRLRIGARLTRYRNCKFHNFARSISRHADGISRYSVPPCAGPLLPLEVRGGQGREGEKPNPQILWPKTALYDRCDKLAIRTSQLADDGTVYLTSILPVMASPEVWLGPWGHVDFNSLGNNPSVCNFCNFPLKLFAETAETDSSC